MQKSTLFHVLRTQRQEGLNEKSIVEMMHCIWIPLMNLAKEYKIGMNMTYLIENGEARSAAAPRSDKKRLARFTPSSDGLFYLLRTFPL